MRLSNERVMILPFEPSIHGPVIYRWFYSGDYGTLFDNLPLLTMQDCLMLKDVFVIVNPKQPDQVYGIFALRNKDERNRNLQLHTMIDKQYQAQGIVKEAAKFMIYYVMNCMNYYKVIALIREGNLAPEKAAKSFGCELEGILKHQIYVDGEFHDMKSYYITKGMFNKRYKQALEAEVKGATP